MTPPPTLQAEREALEAERGELIALLADEGLQWKAIAADLREQRKRFGAKARFVGLDLVGSG